MRLSRLNIHVHLCMVLPEMTGDFAKLFFNIIKPPAC